MRRSSLWAAAPWKGAHAAVRGHRGATQAGARRGCDHRRRRPGSRGTRSRRAPSAAVGARPIPGSIGQDDIRGHYARADIFCLPSFAEGIPVVAIEAMAMELPVVTTRIMGIPELVEDGTEGLLTPPGRVGALTEALDRLVRAPEERRRMGRAARRRVETDYDVARSAERMRAVLEDELGLAFGGRSSVPLPQAHMLTMPAGAPWGSRGARSTNSRCQSSKLSSVQMPRESSSTPPRGGRAARDVLLAEVSAAERVPVEQHVARVVAQLVAEPFGQRQPEAALGRVEHLVRHPAAQRPAQGDLLLPAADLVARRQRGRELHQLVVEQRRPRLERRRHRRDVDLHEQVVGQVGLRRRRRACRRPRRARSARSHGPADDLVGEPSARLARYSARVEPVAVEPVEVASCTPGSGRARPAAAPGETRRGRLAPRVDAAALRQARCRRRQRARRSGRGSRVQSRRRRVLRRSAGSRRSSSPPSPLSATVTCRRAISAR